jgi:hypothetical protein
MFYLLKNDTLSIIVKPLRIPVYHTLKEYKGNCLEIELETYTSIHRMQYIPIVNVWPSTICVRLTVRNGRITCHHLICRMQIIKLLVHKMTWTLRSQNVHEQSPIGHYNQWTKIKSDKDYHKIKNHNTGTKSLKIPYTS